MLATVSSVLSRRASEVRKKLATSSMPADMAASRRDGSVMLNNKARAPKKSSTDSSDTKGRAMAHQPRSSEDQFMATIKPSQQRARMASVATAKAASRP